ncbi:hypothetical protein BU26DRAFT_186020 [Trematosphaeria pertusa]|uniref:WSC domain-containing protein n=1 Tax=Trematosphaeria pertusa TaxID=390896 RepID=A0A6A6HSN9_9PLEO|nr:uncharacterized protein BU26DRAFT_186020 [Trematosphaeria pertusa]KAF2241017.1 hypothetical protein BU26DRAFT_186020 [Trematosphaeria pertusa]
MKNAIGYFIAGAALLPELALAQKIIPTVLPTYWSYKGCYSDYDWNLPGDRALTFLGPMKNPNSGWYCTTYCQGLNLNYTYAGTNDNQCWCDTAINKNGTTTYGQVMPSTDCTGNGTLVTKGCRGNTTEACGSQRSATTPVRLSIYEYKPVSDFIYACVLMLYALLYFFLFHLVRLGCWKDCQEWRRTKGSPGSI